ncbi:MAG TPA: class I SAM-dependent methyltransferase [Candidatus Binatia bacterium]|jgi:2-polyprenyl-3-methyl-5-hydroxy-6-metoxy-1,4-benzoquinol methylase|nr:class I SAM-dependent methyltransferase [Candidatus Binatia bacterium]
MAELDVDRLKAYAKVVFGALGGAMTSAMICLGDRLGLYRALADGEPTDSVALAARTGLAERWVREWLHQQGAAGVLEHRGDGRFALSAEGRAVLAEEASPAFGAGFFSHFPQMMSVVDLLPEAFRTGVGLPYDAFGPEGAAGIERGFAPWFRALLVPLALPAVPGLTDVLAAGATVADVGCGSGVALIEMAKAFPRSTFHGWDVSEYALGRAEENRATAGISNVTFHDARRDPLPTDGRFAFVTTFDCLHDMTHPQAVMGAIRSAIRPDGVWLICDIKARESYEANVARNPMAAMMYGTSVLTCMSSALSEPGGAGLGTLGLTADLARRMTQEAGFASFEPLELGHPINAFYVVRP